MENEKLAQGVKELRKVKGFSQEELAKNSGLSLRTIQRLENGETEPSGETLKRISTVFLKCGKKRIMYSKEHKTVAAKMGTNFVSGNS